MRRTREDFILTLGVSGFSEAKLLGTPTNTKPNRQSIPDWRFIRFYTPARRFL